MLSKTFPKKKRVGVFNLGTVRFHEVQKVGDLPFQDIPKKKGEIPKLPINHWLVVFEKNLTKRLKESALCQRVSSSKIKSKINLDSYKTGVVI